MSDILKKITEIKRKEIASAKNKVGQDELLAAIKQADRPRKFCEAIENAIINSNGTALIAEIKRASPSKGIIRENFNVAELAKQYQQGGATCLSVLTDEHFFLGSLDYIAQAKQASTLPVLRKDFMLDVYQIFEARAKGADCILIIMAMVSDDDAKLLESTAHELNMDVILEVHNENELQRALQLESKLIGINNRDLKTFKTDLATTKQLAEKIQSGGSLSTSHQKKSGGSLSTSHQKNSRIVISESGFNNSAQLQEMKQFGVHAFLIGEALMKCENVEQATREILA